MSLALEQSRLAPVQPWGCCPRARAIFGTLQPAPEKTAIADKIITYRFFRFGELLSVMTTGNFTA